MHEYSIVQSLVEHAQEEARARGAVRIAIVRVAIGEQAGVDPELLVLAWETFRDQDLLQDAVLDVRRVAAVWDCPSCGASLRPEDRKTCAACGAPARLIRGDEITLERLEVEVPDV